LLNTCAVISSFYNSHHRHSSPPLYHSNHELFFSQVGTQGRSRDDIKSVTFEVCDLEVGITLDNVLGDFGIRETSVGVNRNLSVKINTNRPACPAAAGEPTTTRTRNPTTPPPTTATPTTKKPTKAPTKKPKTK
jgi:hypothetical protein